MHQIRSDDRQGAIELEPGPSTPFRAAALRGVTIGLVLGLILGGGYVLANWWDVSPYGHPDGITLIEIIIAMLALSLFIVGTAAIPFVFVRNQQVVGITWSTMLMGFAPLVISALPISINVRESAFAALAERSKRVTDAKTIFQANEGRPPSELSELVPEYLTELPTTGMGTYPSYRYAVEEADPSNPRGWQLGVNTPRGPFRWDCFIFDPENNVPGRIDEKSYYKRFGDWVYVYWTI